MSVCLSRLILTLTLSTLPIWGLRCVPWLYITAMIGSVSLYDDDDDKCVEVVRALDSRCQVPQVATVHGRMPPLYIYWCRIASCMIQAVSSFCLLFFSPIFMLVLYSLQYSSLLICHLFIIYILVSECAAFMPSLFCIYVGAILLPVSTPIHWYALSIFSQIDWRKAKNETIHRIQDKYQKSNFPREI